MIPPAVSALQNLFVASWQAQISFTQPIEILKINLMKKIPIGIRSCLLGENVRFDGGHKRDSYITGTLGQYFEFHPFCPEMGIGLGTPRRLSIWKK